MRLISTGTVRYMNPSDSSQSYRPVPQSSRSKETIFLAVAVCSSPSQPLPPTTMPLIMSPCAQDDTNDLAQAHLATFAYSAPSPSKHYLKVTDTSTNESAAYAIWISLPPSHERNNPADHDPWLLSSSQLVTTDNDGGNSGLCIGIRERLWSSCLYRGARAASKFRRFGLKVKGVDRLCRRRARDVGG